MHRNNDYLRKVLAKYLKYRAPLIGTITYKTYKNLMHALVDYTRKTPVAVRVGEKERFFLILQRKRILSRLISVNAISVTNTQYFVEISILCKILKRLHMTIFNHLFNIPNILLSKCETFF